MTKALPKYLLLILTILLGGYGQLSAHQSNGSLYSIKRIKGTEHVCIAVSRHEDEMFFKSSFNTENQKYKIGVPFFENEEEDDEPISFKKHFGSGHSSASASFGQSADHLAGHKKVLPFNWFFSFTSSSRYIVFKVFRI